MHGAATRGQWLRRDGGVMVTMKDTRDSVRDMRTRLESGQGDRTAAMCRLSLPMAEFLLEHINKLEAPTSCWHCSVVLAPDERRPRCEDCPDECDIEGCEEPGCDDEEAG